MYRNISANKSNSAALIMELCEITCFASLSDVTGDTANSDWVILLSSVEDEDASVLLDTADEDEAVLNALLAAAFSIGLCDIDSRQRNIKCQV